MRPRTPRLPCRLLTAAALLGLCAGPDAARGQSALPVEALRAELQAPRSLCSPDNPIRLRFVLLNTSDEPVAIPLAQPVDESGGVALPLELALGTSSQAAVHITYESDPPQELRPPAAAPGGETRAILRLAPHGSVGTEIDLRDYFPAVRYPGTYRVEWRPLDGRLGSVAAEFRVEPRKDAIFVTDYGKLTFSLEYDRAPRNVENFLALVNQGFYNGKTLHRIVPGFLVQGGCPKGDGTGIRPDGRLVPAEFHAAPIDLGTLAMARKPSDPNSASCQFFIALARLPGLDGQYTVIGQARDEESIRTLQQLAALPTDKSDRPLVPVIIRSVNLVEGQDSRTRHLGLRSVPPASPPAAPAAAPATPAVPPTEQTPPETP